VADRIEGECEGLLGLLLVCLGDIDALQDRGSILMPSALAVSRVSRAMQRVAVWALLFSRISTPMQPSTVARHARVGQELGLADPG
jgi:hypothetical protein